MSQTKTTRCPSCNAAAVGKFCSECGAALEAPVCRQCGGALRPGVKFCGQCGSAVTPAAPGPGTTAAPPGPSGRGALPYAVAGGAVLVLALVYTLRGQPAGGAPPANQGPAVAAEGGLPDLSTMSPREAFTRLFERVMRASESGDTATANRFTPMALMAYGNLPEVDADARYDVALIHLHTGNLAAATALADSIQAGQPKHLFGFVLRAAIARFEGQPDRARQAYRDFLAVADEELKAGRPEYEAHKSMLDSFRQTAANGQ